MSSELLKKVYDFADKAHHGQVRKYSREKYINHPERVMKICQEYTNENSILSAALLHDVLEDTAVGEKEIRTFLEEVMMHSEAEKTFLLVVDLTDIYIDDNYPKFNRQKRKTKEAERLSNVHPDAQTVKYADTIDNAVDIVENDKDFGRVFIKECQYLLSKMDKGHPDLYQRAVITVDKCAEKLFR